MLDYSLQNQIERITELDFMFPINYVPGTV